jgi:hypothetical protein
MKWHPWYFAYLGKRGWILLVFTNLLTMAIFSFSLKPYEALCICDNRLIEICIHFFHLEQPILEAIIGFVDSSSSIDA